MPFQNCKNISRLDLDVCFLLYSTVQVEFVCHSWRSWSLSIRLLSVCQCSTKFHSTSSWQQARSSSPYQGYSSHIPRSVLHW